MRCHIACAGLLIALLGASQSSAEAGDAQSGSPPKPVVGGTLELREVLESVESHYPLLAAVTEERSIAQARQLSREGAFDFLVGGGAKLKPEGFYETYEGDAFFNQPTQLWGAEFFGGYRIGSGDFAVWDGGDETNDGGEFRLGFKLPLLRDRAIDKRRAELRKSEIAAFAAEPVVRERLLAFTRSASFAYWNWVAAGMRVEVARQLLETAESRQSQLVRRVDKGALPAIDLLDNERLIVDRQVRKIAAERTFQQAAIELSLFLRDQSGETLMVDSTRLPPAFPPEKDPDERDLEIDIARAFSQQPILQKLDFEAEKFQLELSLAENRLLPNVDLAIVGSKDIGGAAKNPDDKGDGVLEAKVQIALPVQRREAKGELLAAQAQLRQVQSEQRFARDRIIAEVKKAQAALRAAFDQLGATRQNLQLARRLGTAEDRKLMLGTSNLINVNLRELQAFDAASSLISAQADYFRALANYRAAIGDIGDDGDLLPEVSG